MRNRLLDLLVDSLISSLGSLVISVLLWTFFNSLGVVGVLLFGFLGLFGALPLLLTYGPFAAFVLFGILKLRFGFIVGPALLAVACFAAVKARELSDRAEIAALTSSVDRPSRADDPILAIDNTVMNCDGRCIRVIATTAFPLALRSEYLKERTWAVYRRGEGTVCFEDANAMSALEFLKFGYPGKCAIKTDTADFGDGVIFRERTVDDYRHAADMPSGFRGSVYEVLERRSGHDRLLERRLRGYLRSPLPAALPALGGGGSSIDAGPEIDVDRFLANAIGVDPKQFTARATPFPFDEALDGVEKFLGRDTIIEMGQRGSVSNVAAYTWLSILLYDGSSRRDEHIDGLRIRIARLIAADDPSSAAVALSGLLGLGSRSAGWFDDRVLSLAFNPRLLQKNSPVVEPLTRWLKAHNSAFPADVRERARERLGGSDLSPDQRQILQLVLSQGR